MIYNNTDQKLKLKINLMLWVDKVIDSICQLSEDHKKMVYASCDRIINSYITTFKVKQHFWKAVALSTIWLVIKAYCIDEEEDEWIDACYMSEFSQEVSRKQIITFERLIFQHLDFEVIGPEKRSQLNSCYKTE